MIISSVSISSSRASATGSVSSGASPRTELDSHANMVVLGKHAFIFESTGKTCNVLPFTKELGFASNVPIVDGAIAYDCPYTGVTSILLVRNALHIPTMDHNLIPPFIMRAGGVTVNDVPKIHCVDPSTNDHCISFSGEALRIPLNLIGTFSYFHTRLPIYDELHNCDKFFITPDASDWNPHCESFEKNERTMLNFEGEMNGSSHRSTLPMEVEHDSNDIFEMATVHVKEWNSNINANISSCFSSEDHTVSDVVPTASLDNDFAEALGMRAEISKM